VRHKKGNAGDNCARERGRLEKGEIYMKSCILIFRLVL